MSGAPVGFTNAGWHQDATAVAGTDHVRHPRQFVMTCEWCDHVVFGATKAAAMTKLQMHRDELYNEYLDEGVAAGRFSDPRLREPNVALTPTETNRTPS